MRKFTRHEGVAAALIQENIDTDAIIPSVEMKQVSKHGLSTGLFAGWRYSDRVARTPNPDFVLNNEQYRGASILLAGQNFGCGSSREHAVWALKEFGIRVIIAPSFGAIFKANCVANGLLPIVMDANTIARLAAFVEQDPQHHHLVVDLQQQAILATPDLEVNFEIPASDAEMLLSGWDPVELTLQLEDEIERFTQIDKKDRPWAYL